jgi:hypothetical protein
MLNPLFQFSRNEFVQRAGYVGLVGHAFSGSPHLNSFPITRRNTYIDTLVFLEAIPGRILKRLLFGLEVRNMLKFAALEILQYLEFLFIQC